MDQKVKVIFRLERDDDGYPPEDFESLWGSRRTEGVEIDNGLLAVDVPPTVSLNSFRRHAADR